MATRRRRAGQARVQADMNRVLYGGGERPARASTVQGEAKRQTRADKQDFKKNRAAGDEEMRIRANDSADAKWGGPKFPQSKNHKGDNNRKLVDDSEKIITQKTPNMPKSEKSIAESRAAKRDMEERKKQQFNQQELDDLKRMEQEAGEEWLKKQDKRNA